MEFSFLINPQHVNCTGKGSTEEARERTANTHATSERFVRICTANRLMCMPLILYVKLHAFYVLKHILLSSCIIFFSDVLKLK
jgi:hypothetical protein